MLFFLPKITDLRLDVSAFGLVASGVEDPGLVGAFAKYEVGLPGECVVIGVCRFVDVGEVAPDDRARGPLFRTLLTYLSKDELECQFACPAAELTLHATRTHTSSNPARLAFPDR